MRKSISILGFLMVSMLMLSFLSPYTIASTSSILATKDSYVDPIVPTGNYGAEQFLYMGSGVHPTNPCESYFGFNTSSPPSGWTKAEVEIHMYYILESVNLLVSLITESWEELSITWNNKPAHGQEITQFTASAEKVYVIDVTDFISGDSLSICVNVTTLDPAYVQAASREGVSTIHSGPTLKWTYPTPTEGIPFEVIIISSVIGGVVVIAVAVVIVMRKKRK